MYANTQEDMQTFVHGEKWAPIQNSCSNAKAEDSERGGQDESLTHLRSLGAHKAAIRTCRLCLPAEGLVSNQ